MINKTKLKLLLLADKHLKDDETLEQSMARLIGYVSDKSPIKADTAAKNTAPKTEKLQKKPKSRWLTSHENYMEILQAMILIRSETRKSPVIKEAVKLAGIRPSSVLDAGVYLQSHGYLEKQGGGRFTVWTILKNPDGTDFNPGAPVKVTLPAGKAHGYGQKEDRATYNKSQRPW